MKILETKRLTLRLQTTDDADFILELMNEPSWLEFIGDRGVRTVEDTREYIVNGPTRMYEQFGYCLYLVERTEDQIPLFCEKNGWKKVNEEGEKEKYWVMK